MHELKTKTETQIKDPQILSGKNVLNLGINPKQPKEQICQTNEHGP
jgi:hypothetical protein